MVRTKLVPKRVKIRTLPPRAPSIKFKIKSIIPEQKTVQIKKKTEKWLKLLLWEGKNKIYWSLGKKILMGEVVKAFNKFNLILTNDFFYQKHAIIIYILT